MGAKVSAKTAGIIILMWLILVFGAFLAGRNSTADEIRRLRAIAEDTILLHEEISTSKNKAMSLEKALDEMASENVHLSALVSSLESKPSEVRYITTTETVLVPAEPEHIYHQLPANYVHKINDIPVAEFWAQDDIYRFMTYELRYQTTLVTGKKDSAVLVQVASSKDDVWHEVPTTLTVADTSRDYPWLGPSLHIGVSGHSTQLTPSLVVSMPLIHATRSLDFIAPAVSLSEQPSGDLYLVAYNFGDPLPVVDDLWLAGGISMDTDLQPGVALAITSQF